MGKSVGITGSRHGMTDCQRAMLEGLLPGDLEEFHHGSCKGVDVQAAVMVRTLLGDKPRIYAHPGPDHDDCREDSEVDTETLPPMSHFKRNRAIVDLCDEIFACPYNMTEQPFGGTWYTIRYARKVGKKVTVIYPNGSLGD